MNSNINNNNKTKMIAIDVEMIVASGTSFWKLGSTVVFDEKEVLVMTG